MSVDEMAFRPGFIPGTCENGHVSYPGFACLTGGSLTLKTTARSGRCPACGAPRHIPAGVWRPQPDGTVTREEPTG